MSKKSEHVSQSILEEYDYIGNSASATDCTGLIPSAPLSRAERDSYQDIYHYQPKITAVPHQTGSSCPSSAPPQNPA